MATGVLVVLLGRATRAAEFAEGHDEGLHAPILRSRPCHRTPWTPTGRRARRARACAQNEGGMLAAVLPAFRGDVSSSCRPCTRPSSWAASKLYEIARAGGEVERKARARQRYTRLGVLRAAARAGTSCWTMECSQGHLYPLAVRRTSVRRLGLRGVHVRALRRTRSGAFPVERALTLEEIELPGRGGAACCRWTRCSPASPVAAPDP